MGQMLGILFYSKVRRTAMKENGMEMTILRDKSIFVSFIQTIIRYKLYSYTYNV